MLPDVDGDGLASWQEYAVGNDPAVGDNDPEIRVAEYYLMTSSRSVHGGLARII